MLVYTMAIRALGTVRPSVSSFVLKPTVNMLYILKRKLILSGKTCTSNEDQSIELRIKIKII